MKLSHRLSSVPFWLIHVLALGVLFFHFQWKWLAVCVGLYIVRMFGLTAGYHRYFSHRSYKLSRVPQFIMAFLGTLTVQKGVLWWAANYRHHHKFSDQENDIHSPVQCCFWWSHVGWILSPKYEETQWSQIQDFAKYPELRWLNRYFLLPPIALGVGLYLWGGML